MSLTPAGDGKPALLPSSDSASAGERPSSTDVQEWERRLVTGDLPEDFLTVTEPSTSLCATSAADSTVQTSSASNVTANATATVTSLMFPQMEGDKDSMPQLESTQTETWTTSSDQGLRVELEKEEKRPMTTEEKDHALAMQLQRQLNMEETQQQNTSNFAAATVSPTGVPIIHHAELPPPPNAQGKLTVTVVKSRLAKNYGLTRMDPYCRVRVGHFVYETPTCPNGSVEPKWDKTFTCYLLNGVKTIELEIYDECTFSNDSLTAYATVKIPEDVTKRFMVVEDWWPLSGQAGPDKEGMIHMILSMQPITATTSTTVQMMPGQRVALPTAGGLQPVPSPSRPRLTKEQLDEFCKMFPNLDKEVIASVFMEKGGHQEATINSLLTLSGS